ncbi:MAG: protein-L-isoaspartate(D-aspartate) O-methyltransferase [Sphingobacteriia bacterium]|nr:protein-L-isoaspartate(D-aspartate) O-methyltransferase [Sphingobacteriia bacterium]
MKSLQNFSWLLVFLTVLTPIFSPAQYPGERKSEREALVRTYIIGKGIEDSAVINALFKVERHLFVPSEIKPYAYHDQPLPIGEGQTISQPSLVAFMTDLLDLKKTDKVLEIGTGSGYQAAILAEIVDSVFSVEIIENLGLNAQKLLKKLGYRNIQIKIGDGYIGWAEHSPFNAIIVTCAPSDVPKPLQDQLAEGGRMVIPVGEKDKVQELVLLRKHKGKLKQETILPVRFVPMLKENGRRY